MFCISYLISFGGFIRQREIPERFMVVELTAETIGLPGLVYL